MYNFRLLKKSRQMKGWTQMEVAILAGVSIPTVHRAECGKMKNNMKSVRKIAFALGLKLTEVIK